MRTIKDTAQFKKDYKRVARGQYKATVDVDLLALLPSLATDQPLPAKYRDHPLTGDYTGHRECHLKPDLLLIYKKPDETTLRLVASWFPQRTFLRIPVLLWTELIHLNR